MKKNVHSISDKLEEFGGGELVWNSYISQLTDYVVSQHYYDRNTWRLFVNQFRNHSDSDGRWRGEYWGKSMRSAASIYRMNPNNKLYEILEESVADLLSTQDSDGRIATYPKEKEFFGWDMWCRKYVILGCLYFYDICKDKTLKAKILEALKKHMDYIVERIGEGENQHSIFTTSDDWGGLNSCSILEAVVRLYKYTGKEKYFQFARYIADSGFCKDMNIFDACLYKKKFPYQFVFTKAYEMMSCFQGLLELYTLTGEKDYLRAVVNFTDLVYESEITIIGSAGCSGECFDHAAEKQTVYSDREMQETCVTVTWMNLCFRLLKHTGDVKYASWIERSALNAMNGSVNIKNQIGRRIENFDPRDPKEPYRGKKQIMPFDSYSPLMYGHRGKLIGGFNVMEDERIYGCCASIGGLGLAIEEQFGIMKGQDGIIVNLYENAHLQANYKSCKIDLTIKAKILKNGQVCVCVSSSEPLKIKFRIPEWTKTYAITIDGVMVDDEVKDGYVSIEKKWDGNIVSLTFDNALHVIERGGKKAFEKGPYVLARDEAFGENIRDIVRLEQEIQSRIIDNTSFNSDIALKVKTKDGDISLCDYAHAGKMYDREHTDITVWMD